MSKSNRTIMKTIFLGVFILAGTFNVSYGQANVEKLDKLIRSLVFDTKDKKAITMVLFGRVKFRRVVGGNTR